MGPVQWNVRLMQSLRPIPRAGLRSKKIGGAYFQRRGVGEVPGNQGESGDALTPELSAEAKVLKWAEMRTGPKSAAGKSGINAENPLADLKSFFGEDSPGGFLSGLLAAAAKQGEEEIKQDKLMAEDKKMEKKTKIQEYQEAGSPSFRHPETENIFSEEARRKAAKALITAAAVQAQSEEQLKKQEISQAKKTLDSRPSFRRVEVPTPASFKRLDTGKKPPFKRVEVEDNSAVTRASIVELKSDKNDSSVEYVKIGDQFPYHLAFLRDSCTCTKCVDSSSKQKNFQTSDIPSNIKVSSLTTEEDGNVVITWENDVPGFDSNHTSIYPPGFFKIHSSPTSLLRDRFETTRTTFWNKERIKKELEFVNYDEYLKNDEILYRAVSQLHRHGLLLVRGVPESEKSVEEIANRIGNIRDTFYGRTWDVKSVPEAKNVAYTAQFLGLHMDLLYMANPPGLQFLHCLKNTCEGGSSLFSDAFNAASQLTPESFKTLSTMNVAYHYRNAGEHYYYEHPVIKLAGLPFLTDRNQQHIDHINYSPPFQAPHAATGKLQQSHFPQLVSALKEFSSLLESEENLYEYKLQEGECVIFNNRRALHGRRQFDASGGERWLKGTYVDTDVFKSRYRVLRERFGSKTWAEMEERQELFKVNPVTRSVGKNVTEN